MKIRYNIIFIPLLVVVGFAVWFLGFREQEEASARRLADRALLNRDEIDVIEIVRSGRTMRLERRSEGRNGATQDWLITQPYIAGCDASSLAGLIDGLFEVEAQRDFDDVTPEQLDEYSVSEPELRIRCASATGEVLMDLSIGGRNPSGAARYAAFTDKPSSCFLVPIYHVEPLEITPENLRDHRALDIKPDQVVAIQLSTADQDLLLEKEDTAWRLTSPESFTASLARVDILIHDLLELQAAEFLPVGADDPELSTMDVAVSLRMSDGSEKSLTLHGEDYSRGIFVTSSYQPSPFIVEPYIHDRLALGPDVFFHVDLIDIAPERIARIHVRQPGADNLEIERTGSGSEDWRILRPADRLYTDPGDFDRLLNSLLALQPEDSIPAPANLQSYGLDPVYFMKIEVFREDEGSQSAVYLGSTDPDGNYYATQDNISYFTINSGLVQHFISAVDKLRGIL